MNRQLYCTIVRGVDTAPGMAAELVQHGFIHSHDSQVNVWSDKFKFSTEGGGAQFQGTPPFKEGNSSYKLWLYHRVKRALCLKLLKIPVKRGVRCVQGKLNTAVSLRDTYFTLIAVSKNSKEYLFIWRTDRGICCW